jgi:uroporphyrinogen decarboxylase
MYKDIIQSGHIYTINYAHEHKLPVIMHSCGFVEPLLPGMIESGIDCLQALEVKAGMDLLKLYKQYGDQIAFMGGIDVRSITSNDKKKIDEELMAKMPTLKEKNAYIIHSDHSIPSTVDYEVYKYFIEKSLELGTN